VVGPRVGSSEGAAKLAHDAAQVGEKIVVKRSGDKSDMFFRPSGAWGEFYSIPLPTACAVGYDLSPATRAVMLSG
jgi:hypothetical protein